MPIEKFPYDELIEEIRNLPEAKTAFVRPLNLSQSVDLLGDEGRKKIEERKKRLGNTFRKFINHHRFNPENS